MMNRLSLVGALFAFALTSTLPCSIARAETETSKAFKAFEGEAGKDRFIAAVSKVLDFQEKIAIKKITAMSEEQARLELKKVEAFALKRSSARDLQEVRFAQTMLSAKLALSQLYSSERKAEWLVRLRKLVDSKGSVREAMESIAQCYFDDVGPLLTAYTIVAIFEIGFWADDSVALQILTAPVILALIALLPATLVVDFTVVMPIWIAVDLVECWTDG